MFGKVTKTEVYLESGGELHHLLSLNVLETVNTSDTISDAEYAASFFQVFLMLAET